MQRVVAILYKEGVIYRPANKQAFEGNTESEKSEKRVYSPKDFTSVKDDDGGEDVVKDDGIASANSTTPARNLYNGDPQASALFSGNMGEGTNLILVRNDGPTRSLSSLSSTAFATARQKGPQKRKRMPSAIVRSPYLSENRANKRQINDEKTTNSKFLRAHVNF
jgi:hypothetical protein